MSAAQSKPELSRLPSEISSDGREIFDWAEKFSDHVHRIDEIRRLKAQIHSMENECGSCAIWMTPSCPRESHSNKTGRWSGPSSRALKCGQFSMTVLNTRDLASARERLVTLEAKPSGASS